MTDIIDRFDGKAYGPAEVDLVAQAINDVRDDGPEQIARRVLDALQTAGRLPCYAEHEGMLCDRTFDHLGDHVDIYGPLADHTWAGGA